MRLLTRFIYAGRAVCRKYGLSPARSTSVPDNLVISPGGVGTTILIEHLTNYIAVNCPYDTDGLKHLPKLPARWRKNRKILFVTGDFEDTYNSMKRRGWLFAQSMKLGCVLCQFTDGDRQKEYNRRSVLKQRAAMEQLPDSSVLIIRYEDIWDKLEAIKDFFGIAAPDFVGTFPERQPRTGKAL